MIKKIKSFFVNGFETIINLCLFIIIGSLLVLLSTVSIEYRIVNLSKDIERLNYKANNAMDWGVDISSESNRNLIKNLQSQQIIALLDSDEFFEEKEIRLLIKTVEYGPMTFALAYDDLLANFSEKIDVDQINKKNKQNDLIINTFTDLLNNEGKDGIQKIVIHNREESLFLSKTWYRIYQDSQEEIKILDAAKNELVNFSSYIVLIIFLMQLSLYMIFQLYELYSERRKV